MQMQKYFWGIIIAVVAGLVVWYFKTIFIYIIIAGILALIGQPIDRFYTKYLRFRKLKLSTTLSAGLAFLTLFFIFFLLAIFFVPLIMEEARILSSIDKETVFGSLQKPIESMGRILRNFNVEYDIGKLQAYLQEKMMSILTVTNLSLFFNQLISVFGDLFIALFAISFLTFFFLRDEKMIVDSVLALVPKTHTEKVRNVFNDSERLLKRYFIGIFIEAMLVMVFISAGLWMAGIKHALLIGLFVGIVNIIPYIGPLIGTAFALFIGLTTTPEMGTFALVWKILLVSGSVQIVDNFLFQPLIYSSSVRAHPAEIFLVILAGATIGGIGGMILAVPSYTILRVFVKEFFARS